MFLRSEVPLASTSSLGHIARYKLVDRLATGGMADVFLAVDAQADDEAPLVVKRILPHLAQDEAFVRMFLQEARIAMALDHPNVVQIHKLGEHDGLPFLVMEYIHGLTFRELQKQASQQALPIPVEVVLDLVAQAASGAHAVHETRLGQHSEIVHRDLCPHNLMVDDTGVVKVLDFGIAKAAEGMDTTRTGVLKGKTAYLAPEQVRREDVDRRTDLWALSVVAWELLAGRRMFPGLGDYDLMQRIVSGDVPRLETVRPDLHPAVVEAVHRNLQVDPARRMTNALDLRNALRTAAQTMGSSTNPLATRAFIRAAMGLDDPVAHTDTAHSEVSRTQGTHTGSVATRTLAGDGRGPWWALIGAVFAALAVALFVGSVAIGAFVLSPAPPQGPAVRITFAPVMPPAEMIAELEPLRAHLEQALDRPVALQVAPSYEAAGDMLGQGTTEFAVLPPYLYLQARKSLGPDLHLLAATVHDGSGAVDGVLIARDDLPWTDASSLRGRSFCFTDPSSTTGYVLPRQWLRDHGLDPDHDLGDITFSGNHHQVIEDLARGRCEVGATFSAALRSAFDADVPVQAIRQLDVTGRTPNDAVCSGPQTDPVLAAALRATLLAWDPVALHDARFVGRRQHLSGFVPGDDSGYDALRRALAAEH